MMPEFSELFMSYLLTQNSQIEEDLIDQLFNSSEKRLARLLLLVANFGKEGPITGKFFHRTDSASWVLSNTMEKSRSINEHGSAREAPDQREGWSNWCRIYSALSNLISPSLRKRGHMLRV